MSRFRDFLYLDDRIVGSLLSGIEGGRYDSVSERWSQSQEQSDRLEGQSESSRGVNSSISTERERIVHQDAEARFARLWDLIVDDTDEQVLDSAQTDDIWTSAHEGRFCRLEGRLATPTFAVLAASSPELLKFTKIAERFGAPIGELQDASEKLEAMSAIGELLKDTFPVTLDLDSDSAPIALPLDASQSRVKLDKYTGRATVFGRVIEIVPRGSRYRQLQIPGSTHFTQMSRQQRRKAEREGAPAPEGIELRGPLLVVRALAIYQ